MKKSMLILIVSWFLLFWGSVCIGIDFLCYNNQKVGFTINLLVLKWQPTLSGIGLVLFAASVVTLLLVLVRICITSFSHKESSSGCEE